MFVRSGPHQCHVFTSSLDTTLIKCFGGVIHEVHMHFIHVNDIHYVYIIRFAIPPIVRCLIAMYCIILVLKTLKGHLYFCVVCMQL